MTEHRPTVLFTVQEAAKRAKVNPETVRRWIKSGKLSAVKPGGGAYRILSTHLERLLAASTKRESQHVCVRFHLSSSNEKEPPLLHDYYAGRFGAIKRLPLMLRCQDCGAEYPYPEEVEGWYGFTDAEDDARRVE